LRGWGFEVALSALQEDWQSVTCYAPGVSRLYYSALRRATTRIHTGRAGARPPPLLQSVVFGWTLLTLQATSTHGAAGVWVKPPKAELDGYGGSGRRATAPMQQPGIPESPVGSPQKSGGALGQRVRADRAAEGGRADGRRDSVPSVASSYTSDDAARWYHAQQLMKANMYAAERAEMSAGHFMLTNAVENLLCCGLCVNSMVARRRNAAVVPAPPEPGGSFRRRSDLGASGDSGVTSTHDVDVAPPHSMPTSILRDSGKEWPTHEAPAAAAPAASDILPDDLIHATPEPPEPTGRHSNTESSSFDG